VANAVLVAQVALWVVGKRVRGRAAGVEDAGEGLKTELLAGFAGVVPSCCSLFPADCQSPA
jgi:hypothetical protein